MTAAWKWLLLQVAARLLVGISVCVVVVLVVGIYWWAFTRPANPGSVMLVGIISLCGLAGWGHLVKWAVKYLWGKGR